MSTAEIKPMQDVTNMTCRVRCLSMIEKIKAQRENRKNIPLPTTQCTFSLINQCSFEEIDIIKTSRLQSFVNWPHSTPNAEVMSSSGWFFCNVNDRTVCIYCNTVCHNWMKTDDPYEVHTRLAPECPFMLSITSSLSLSSTTNTQIPLNNNLPENFQPHHASMCEISRRQDTFNDKKWTQTSPSIEELALAGFFYSGTGNTVTCFYCNGSLHQWGENDSPKIEHGRWFPHCLYAKHLCGDILHAKIQISKKQLKTDKNPIDKDMLKRLVNARLDLPIVQRLREKYKLGIIKRCIEDQFKNNQDDFKSDNDLEMACFILQKQIDIIQGNPDKIIVPSQNKVESEVKVEIPKTSSRNLEECVICLTEERQVACMPCGHLCSCVSCGYSTRTCPICRQKIQSFVRIYS